MAYRFLDHTADVAVELSGATLGELFTSAAEALTDTITDRQAVQPSAVRAVHLEAPTLEDLLVDWLNELLYLFEVRNLLTATSTVRVEPREPPFTMDAEVRGETRDPARHPIRVLVKSATYHALSVEQRADGWHARMVLDI